MIAPTQIDHELEGGHYFESNAAQSERIRRESQLLKLQELDPVAENHDWLAMEDGHQLLKITSKVLAMIVDRDCIFIGESGFLARCLDLKTGRVLKTFRGHKGPVTSLLLVTWQDQRYLITASWDKTIRVFDIVSANCIATLSGHSDFVKCLLFLPKGLLISGGSDKRILIWSMASIIQSKDETVPIRSITSHRRPIECLASDPYQNEQFLAGASDGTLKRWHCESGKEVTTYSGHETSVYAIVVDDDAEASEALMWSGSADGTVRCWHLATGQQKGAYSHEQQWIKCLVYQAPFLYVGTREEQLYIWHTVHDRKEKSDHLHFDSLSSIQVLGSQIYTASLDSTIRLRSMTQMLSTVTAPQTALKRNIQNQSIAAKKPVLSLEEEAELEELME